MSDTLRTKLNLMLTAAVAFGIAAAPASEASEPGNA